ncbi:MFS transporter [Tropicimonas sp. S265A]|uniref:MFS transporter n=1 Tax=Tropicimonas sp. S265A TaxID=3415134 RepID=UPI003C79CFBA
MTTTYEPSAESPKTALYSLAAANFAVGTGGLVIAGIVPDLAIGLDVSAPAAGQLITVYALVYALSAPLISVWTSGLDKKCVLLFGIVGLVLSNLAAMWAPSYEVVIAARIASALSAAAITPVAAAIATMIVPPERTGSALGLVFGGIAISTVLGVPAGAFIGGVFDWRATFGLVSVLSVASLMSVLVFVPSRILSARRDFSSLVSVLKDRPAMAAVSVTALVMTAQFIPFSYAAVLFANALSATSAQVFWLLFAFGAASAVGNYFGGVLSDRLTPNRVLSTVLILLPAALFGVWFLSLGFWTALVIMAIWGAIGFSFNAPQQARLTRMRPPQATMLLALNASAIYVGTMLGSAIGGLALAFSTSSSLPVMGALAAFGALLTFCATLEQGTEPKADFQRC